MRRYFAHIERLLFNSSNDEEKGEVMKFLFILSLLFVSQVSFAAEKVARDISDLKITCVVSLPYITPEGKSSSVMYAYEAYPTSKNQISLWVDVSVGKYAPNGNDKIKLNDLKLLIKADFKDKSVLVDKNGMPMILLSLSNKNKKVFSDYVKSGEELNIEYVDESLDEEFVLKIIKCDYNNKNE